MNDRSSKRIAMTLLLATTVVGCDQAEIGPSDFDGDVEYRSDESEAIAALEARVLELEKLHYTNRVFVTSTKYAATFGGASDAAALCQNHADSAGLGGTWVAWISDSSEGSAADNFTQSPYDYTLVDGTVIAHGWDELTDGGLDNLIGLDEDGVSRTGFAWTGTNTDGSTSGYTCSDWTATSSVGKVGSANSDNNGASPQWWTTRGNLSCGSTARLYCFEQ
ncbi:MAG: hypothetical protein AAF799_08350 [Myxococcota bacterium]